MPKKKKAFECKKCLIERPRSLFGISETTGQRYKLCSICLPDSERKRRYGYITCYYCGVRQAKSEYSNKMILRKGQRSCKICEPNFSVRTYHGCEYNLIRENKNLDLKVGKYLRKLHLLSVKSALFWDMHNAA